MTLGRVIAVAVALCVLTGSVARDAEEDTIYKLQREESLARMRSFKKGNYTAMHVLLGIEAAPGQEAQVLAALPAGATSLAEPYRAVFFPQVDQFALLRVNGTRGLVFTNATVRVWVELGGVRSESKRVIVGDRIVGSRSVIVTLNRGNITAIDWDDDCSTCVSADCLDGTCSFSTMTLETPCDDPAALAQDAFRCAVKLYVVWAGTDSSNKDMTSISKLPSRFYKYSLVSNIYEAAAGFWEDFTNAWMLVLCPFPFLFHSCLSYAILPSQTVHQRINYDAQPHRQ